MNIDVVSKVLSVADRYDVAMQILNEEGWSESEMDDVLLKYKRKMEYALKDLKPEHIYKIRDGIALLDEVGRNRILRAALKLICDIICDREFPSV